MSWVVLDWLVMVRMRGVVSCRNHASNMSRALVMFSSCVFAVACCVVQYVSCL